MKCPAAPLLALFLSLASSTGLAEGPATPVARCLPGEETAEQVLDAAHKWRSSAGALRTGDLTGFEKGRLGQVPAPGVHPRVLLGPEDLPDLRRRLAGTNVGRALHQTLRERIAESLHRPAYWGTALYALLSTGDEAGARRMITEHKGLPAPVGHYQPYLYALVMEAFEAMLMEDQERGRAVATALATYARLYRPALERCLEGPLNDDLWRAKGPAAKSGDVLLDADPRDVVGGHLLGYGYDFAHGFMTGEQRDVVRALIARATQGRIWMGARLPRHFRNWNWIAVGLQQPLLALSIEGEEGYDPRVFSLGVQIARDYFTHGVDADGMSTEAVGYTGFGFVWSDPFCVAAARRGENLLGHPHHRAMLDWYLHCLEPAGSHWTSHGDGGDRGPGLWTVSLWRHFFPGDARTQVLWRAYVREAGREAFSSKAHIIEPLLWASDDPELEKGAKVGPWSGLPEGMPTTWFSDERSSLIARSGWTPEAALVQFECRTDSVGASHEHADRGNFTFAALGRTWAKENFRSVETRHHNGILIDGRGQGYWPGPGRWLGWQEKGGLVVASCDSTDNYSWFWPKQIVTEKPGEFGRFSLPRWAGYVAEATRFGRRYAGVQAELDPRPGVVAFWKGFEKGDPRLWDEDAWPRRLPYNPLRHSFRSIVFNKGPHPYLLVVDDVQKDDAEHLYEWLMQTGPDTELASLKDREVVLCDSSTQRDANGLPLPPKGARLLLVRVLDLADPAGESDAPTRPSLRLETFERKDTLEPEPREAGAPVSRSFGLDKRLVIPSRSLSPRFKILLFPFRQGEAMPVTRWNKDHSVLTLSHAGRTDHYEFRREPSGRTLILPGEPSSKTP